MEIIDNINTIIFFVLSYMAGCFVDKKKYGLSVFLVLVCLSILADK